MPAKTGNVFVDPDSIVRDEKTGKIISKSVLNPENIIPDIGKPTMKLGKMFRDEGTAGLSQRYDPAAELALRDANAGPPDPPAPPAPEPTDGDRAVAAVLDVEPEDVLADRPKLNPTFNEPSALTVSQEEVEELETLRADIMAAKAARKSGGEDGERAEAWLQTAAETEYARPDGGRLAIKRIFSGMKIGRPKETE